MEPRQFKPVPFLGVFYSDQKLDLKAIYKRPRRDGHYNYVRGANGRIQWDETGPLPLRRHADWTAKGFEYITLADAESLRAASRALLENGYQPREFVCDPRTDSPWNHEAYQRYVGQDDSAELAELRHQIDQFGLEAVVAIRKAADPSFALPLELREDGIGAKVPEAPDLALDSLVAVPEGAQELSGEAHENASPPKRKRGRPRKQPVEVSA